MVFMSTAPPLTLSFVCFAQIQNDQAKWLHFIDTKTEQEWTEWEMYELNHLVTVLNHLVTVMNAAHVECMRNPFILSPAL